MIALILALQAGLATAGTASASSASHATQFRVYQNDEALKEFASEAQALAYAKSFAYSHVEKIEGRVWMWDNFPRYKVYDSGFSTDNREFRTLAEARTFAKKLRFAQIRDLQQPGWVEGTYPNYQLYQGDKTLPEWSFATIAEAKKAAKYYTNMHVMELATNQWVWDNLTAAQKTAQRSKTPVYDIIVNGESTGSTKYAFLLDAIRASAKIAGSSVMNTATGQTVHASPAPYTLMQNGKTVRTFYSLGSAIFFAKQFAFASVVKDGSTWWTNVPYLTVTQGDRKLGQFHTRKSAVATAAAYADSVVTTESGRAIWNNKSKLLYLAWNGTSRSSTIEAQVSQTQGLDIDSPSWFELASADGTLTDSSDPALVETMRKSGIQLMPLVHNQFDSVMTSAFLRNSAAQTKFTQALIGRLVELKAAGINLDFEALAGGDRALYTAFVRNFTKAAHQKGLSVSIDLPRGDVSWNHKTAYDHAALADIVDTIMIMAYDQHWKGSDKAGSVGELRWVEDGVKQFLDYGIPRSKLMLGIPFYVREWRIDGNGKLIDNKAILMKDIPAIIQENGAKGVLDAKSGQLKYTYYKNGYKHVFWAETASTVKARIALAKKYDLAGVAIWRLGYESADLWTMMLQQK